MRVEYLDEHDGFYRTGHSLTRVFSHFYNAHAAEVAKWQTRTFEGRVGKPVRVQVPPSAPSFLPPLFSGLLRDSPSPLLTVC